jgi:crotonobetainyl-CoA:carnitine CoA-transferase CaiB-like acyl-CoA transferase
MAANAWSEPYLPLRGARVLSFEVAFSLPAGTRTLAELGADVVRVAGPKRRADDYISVIDGVYLSKANVGINLKKRDGRALARELIGKADAVCYNMVPAVMRRYQMSPAELAAERPDLVLLQVSGYGIPGPWADYPAFGPSTEAAGGLNALTGQPSDPPVRAGSGVFSDQIAGRYSALALVTALERRARTGEGAIIDLSMTEAISTLLGGFAVRAQRHGGQPARPGNRHPQFAPQGIYRCAGEDEWVAITVKDERQWRALVEVTGDEALGAAAYDTLEGRCRGHDVIDDQIERWTGARRKEDVAERLQVAGVAAGPVRKVQDALFDEHLAKTGLFQRVQHAEPYNGYLAHPHPRLPWRAGGRPAAELREIRPTGADNVDVLERWLGMNRADIERLEAGGALLREERIDFVDRPTPQGSPHDEDAGRRLGLPAADAT